MKSLQEDLKTGNFKKAYLLFGEESYLRQQYKEKLDKSPESPGRYHEFYPV